MIVDPQGNFDFRQERQGVFAAEIFRRVLQAGFTAVAAERPSGTDAALPAEQGDDSVSDASTHEENGVSDVEISG
jgi:hypothetical protein